MIRLSLILFTLFISVYFFSVEFDYIDSVPIGVETILVITFSIVFLYEQVNKPTIQFIYNKYEFWVIVGFLIYLAGSFFIYIYANQIPSEEIEKVWFVTYIFNIIKNILFSIAVLVHVKERKNPPSVHRHPQPFLN